MTDRREPADETASPDIGDADLTLQKETIQDLEVSDEATVDVQGGMTGSVATYTTCSAST